MKSEADPVAFGRELRLARQHAGLSLRALARRIDYSVEAIRLWEAGRREANPTAVRHLEIALDLSSGTLMRWLYPPAERPAVTPLEQAITADSTLTIRQREALHLVLVAFREGNA